MCCKNGFTFEKEDPNMNLLSNNFTGISNVYSEYSKLHFQTFKKVKEEKSINIEGTVLINGREKKQFSGKISKEKLELYIYNEKADLILIQGDNDTKGKIMLLKGYYGKKDEKFTGNIQEKGRNIGGFYIKIQNDEFWETNFIDSTKRTV